MKKTFMLTCMLVFSYTIFGQQIKSKNVELDDFITLLGSAGYELFNFDITDMLKEHYNIVFVRKEYAEGKEIRSINLNMVSNKTLLSEYSEPVRKTNLFLFFCSVQCGMMSNLIYFGSVVRTRLTPICRAKY